MLKIVIALVLLAHAIGHSMGPLQVFKVAAINPDWAGDSWLLTGPMGTAAAQAIGVILWTAALVGFMLAAGVVLGWLPQGWWPALPVVSAVASLAALLIFPVAFPLTSAIGALVVDVAVLAAVLWLNLTPADLAS